MAIFRSQSFSRVKRALSFKKRGRKQAAADEPGEPVPAAASEPTIAEQPDAPPPPADTSPQSEAPAPEPPASTAEELAAEEEPAVLVIAPSPSARLEPEPINVIHPAVEATSGLIACLEGQSSSYFDLSKAGGAEAAEVDSEPEVEADANAPPLSPTRDELSVIFGEASYPAEEAAAAAAAMTAAMAEEATAALEADAVSVEPMEGQAAAAEPAKAPEVVVEEESAAAIEAVPVTAEDEAETETSSCFTSDASSSSLLAEEASGATVLEGGVSEDEVSEQDMSEPEMDDGAEDGAADDEGEEDEAVAANARAYADLYAEYAHEAAARAAEEPSLFDLLKRSVSNMSASLLSPRALHCLGRSSAAESQEPQPAAGDEEAATASEAEAAPSSPDEESVASDEEAVRAAVVTRDRALLLLKAEAREYAEVAWERASRRSAASRVSRSSSVASSARSAE